jgi:transcriptional regulator with XRE-family HTH domain
MSETFEQVFARRVHQLRLGRGLSQVEVATAIGIGPSSLSRLESGFRAIRLNEAVKLAILYGMTVETVVSPGLGRIEQCLRTGSGSVPSPPGGGSDSATAACANSPE